MALLAPASRKYLLRFIVVAVAMAAATIAGFLLLPSGAPATLIWPPSAAGIALLFLFDYDLWPAVTLSILGVLLLRIDSVPFDLSIAVVDTLEAFMGAYFLRNYVGLNPMLARLRDSLGLLVACIAPTLVSGIIITLSSLALGRTSVEEVQSTFAAIWIGHAVSALSFTPFLIRWLHRPFFYKTRDELLEGVLIFGSLIACAYFLFWTQTVTFGTISLTYVLLIPLLWASLRSGPRGTTLALALVAGIGTTGTIYGSGPLSQSSNPHAVFLLQILLGALDVLFLIITSIVEERKEAVIQLRGNVLKLESAIEKIRSEDQAKTNFLAILAHELRNPLAPIVTSVELLKSDAQSPADPALIETIESHAHTMSLLLDDLLDVSRITQNKFELRRERLQLSTAVKHSLQSVTPFMKSREHTLEVSLPKEDLMLDADPVRFEQILVNLLNNAAKYTDPGGRITLTCAREGRYVVMRVADTGIGIAPEKLHGVFEPFGQRGAVLRAPGGLGIGLSLTKQLAELHGGTIEAQSEGLDKGSTFTVRLPLSSDANSASTASALSFVSRLRSRSIVQEPRIILVVDDNEPAAKGLAELLKRRGHTTHVALTGKDALEKAAHIKPDTILLDIGLPDMSGYEVAQKIRAMAAGPRKLIALTGYGQDSDRSKSEGAGFDAHLIKPVSLADVEEVL